MTKENCFAIQNRQKKMWLATISLGSGSSNEPRFIIVNWDPR